MQLSIIIVNFNVAAFLEKCLQSVLRAALPLDCEIWVIDNHSVDQSVPMVQKKFPQVKLIENQKNIGFSAANNQAIRQAAGSYILLLNPDTIVSEDCFEKCVEFMDQHLDAGAVGVKMLDGSGKYLPESKRGFPSPWTSLTKMLRANELFPKSKLWNSYYLGHLDENEVHKIDVLTGAFMCIRKSVLDEIGLLDDTFFMYGEDIDLSYRIKKAGYEIYYYPHTTILHYKGESTKKGSINYVRTFYNAMIIFAQKHFTGSQSWLMVIILQAGIYFAAFGKFIAAKLNAVFPALVDTSWLAISIILSKECWEQYYFNDPNYINASFYQYNFPVYIFIWITALWLKGVYYSWIKKIPFLLGTVWGMIGILIVYALMPLSLRSSRIVILLSTALFLVGGLLIRTIVKRRNQGGKTKQIIIVGNTLNIDRIKEVINRAAPDTKVIGAISVYDIYDPAIYVNKIDALQEVAEVYKPDEIIFSAEDVEFGEMTRLMAKLGSRYEYKIASNDSELIVGSASKNVTGEWYGMQIAFQIDTPISTRNKRLFDLSMSFIFLVLFPVVLFANKRWGQLIKNWVHVLLGRKTWFSYDPADPRLKELPYIKPGVIHINTAGASLPIHSLVHNRNYLYAKDYSVWQDLEGVLKNFNRLST